MEVSVERFSVSVVGYGQGTSRARLLKGALLWPNGQIDIPEVLPLQKVVYKGYLGCWVQWMCLFGDLPSMWLGMAKVRLGHVSWTAPYYDPNGQIDIPAVVPMQNVVYKGYLGCWVQWMCPFGDLPSMWIGLAKVRFGHVSWRAPYYDPMVKWTFQQFYRCKKLYTKVILDAEFNGSVCLASWRLCVWVWPRHVSGTSPEGHPIMTQWSNWHCSSSTVSKSCIQRLFWMLSSTEVSVWRVGVSVSGYGQGTSRARPLKGTLLWPNGQIDIAAVLPTHKVAYKGYFGCWVQWMYLFGDFSSMWLGLARARLLKGALLWPNGQMKKNWKIFWKNFKFFF